MQQERDTYQYADNEEQELNLYSHLYYHNKGDSVDNIGEDYLVADEHISLSVASYQALPGNDAPVSVDCVRLFRTDDRDEKFNIVGGNGYLDGNFRSGKVSDIKLPCAAHTMKYAPIAEDGVSLLAVGLKTGLAFYQAATTSNNYSLVYHVATDDMVSALMWLDLGDDNFKMATLVVGCMDGAVYIYRLGDLRALESQGPLLVHQFSVIGQVRAVQCCTLSADVFSSLPAISSTSSLQKLIVAVVVGTRAGQLVVASYTQDLQPIRNHVTVQEISSGILSLSLHVDDEQSLLAWATKDGDVVVHELEITHDASVGLKNHEKPLWSTRRNGPVRSVLFNKRGTRLSFGGYDKKIVIVDTKVWAVARELSLQGTVNVISMDPEEFYLMVGCRDKSFQIFDMSTYICLKRYQTQGWVTAISWSQSGSNILAVRSENKCITVLNLSPVHVVSTNLTSSSKTNDQQALAWSRNGRFLARNQDLSIILSDTFQDFQDVANYELCGLVVNLTFCQAQSNADMLAAIDFSGKLTKCRVRISSLSVDVVCLDSIMIEPHLKALSWSRDGILLAAGGRTKILYVFNAANLKLIRSVEMSGRIWDIDFAPELSVQFLAVALGDYTVAVLNKSFDLVLQISLSRTVRCLKFHPFLPLIAIGDGAGLISLVDYKDENKISEFEAGGRVNCVVFSPMGDFFLPYFPVPVPPPMYNS